MELEVERLLKDKGIVYRLIELSDNARTVADVVRYSVADIDASEICKTIVLTGKKSGKDVAVLLKGNDRVDFREAKKFFGEEMAIAHEERVRKVAGVGPGAVCPFLLKAPLVVDETVMDLERINCGSGDHLHGLEFRTEDLPKAVDYRIAGLSKTL